jgi:hypothetical protein
MFGTASCTASQIAVKNYSSKIRRVLHSVKGTNISNGTVPFVDLQF